VRAQSGATTEWSYTGEQNDPTGLEYLRARYYDASTGRFLSQDPVPLLQRYAYANDNPANLVDPSGLYTAKDAQDALVARFEQLMAAERAIQAVAKQILADPCWKTHAFCKHVAFVWKKAVHGAQRFLDCSAKYPAWACGGLIVGDTVATAGACAVNSGSYFDLQVAYPSGAQGVAGAQVSCHQGLHPYVGAGVGQAGGSFTVGPNESITEGPGCSANLPRFGLGITIQAGRSWPFGSKDSFGEIGGSVGGNAASCYWVGPRP
jgi:RHS repeat-associated protein